MVTGSVTPFPTIVTSLRPAKLIFWVSPGVSSVPFWLRSVVTLKEVASLIVTRDMSEQVLALRFTESKRARSRSALNSLARFWRSKLLPDRSNRDIAIVAKMATTANTINNSIKDAPVCEFVPTIFMYLLPEAVSELDDARFSRCPSI